MLQQAIEKVNEKIEEMESHRAFEAMMKANYSWRCQGGEEDVKDGELRLSCLEAQIARLEKQVADLREENRLLRSNNDLLRECVEEQSKYIRGEKQ